MTVTPTNQSKNLVSPTDTSKNSAVATNLFRAGKGWKFNQAGVTFNGPLDSVTGLRIYFNSLGTGITVTNQTKS